ncbi:MAG: TlpA disulfide reductase family protein [Ignavibacteria bacterium]|jgi:thiol-disulfide isomerase/thioredoxin
MKKIFLIILLIFPIIVSSQEVGKEAVNFSGKTMDDENISLSDYKGKVTLVDVWASWCKPCKEEFPFLIDLYNQYSDKDFSVLTVNIDEEKGNAKKFLSKLDKEVPFKIMFDPESKIPTLYNIESIPSVYILDRKGIVKYIHIGFMNSDKEKYKNEIETLLNE